MAWFWPGPASSPGSDPAAEQSRLPLPLDERAVGRFDPTTIDPSPGRRLRVFAAIICRGESNIIVSSQPQGERFTVAPPPETTYGEMLLSLEKDETFRDQRLSFARLPLRVGDPGPLVLALDEAPPQSSRDPDLHPALQDLADEINEDIREALEALDLPDACYTGVDEDIEPVTDDHVSLVIWALQRELNRELRTGEGHLSTLARLPAAPLAELPWNVQRALAERRRLRFKQWGLGRRQWECGEWSLWDIPADPDYVPRRAQRLAPAAHAAVA